jgi:hypothetical protein
LTNNPRAVAPEFDYSRLRFTSEAPALDDILPEIPLGNETCCRVSDDLVVPHMVDEGRHDLFSREFTRMTRFQSTIQATFFSSLVTKHITAGSRDPASRDAEARNLDAALHSFCSALIPPPEKATGRYCGAFGIRTR